MSPRPFYMIGHNPNTVDKVKECLAAGVNALEPDIMLHNSDLIVCHDKLSYLVPPYGNLPLADYLDEVRKLIENKQANQLALIAFDCKSSAATAAYGEAILTTIRAHLTDFVPDLSIILNVGSFNDVALFDTIFSGKYPLREREGLMIDGENDAFKVLKFFADRHVPNIAYGNGTMFADDFGPHVIPSINQASALRAKNNRPSFTYAYSIDYESTMNELITKGVDGIISDKLDTLKKVIDARSADIYLATREDNPFRPSIYTLLVKTADKALAGTDAKVTFTLNGTAGSTSTTIDTSYKSLMEKNLENGVALGSNIGLLKTITVEHDGSGAGPDWELASIEVRSPKFLQGKVKKASFNTVISKSKPVTKELYLVEVQLDWPTPAGIRYGKPLGSTQLNARATSILDGKAVEGTYVYIPSTGKVLDAGDHTLYVEFTPKELEFTEPITKSKISYKMYEDTSALVSIRVEKATSKVTAHGGIFTFNEESHAGSGTATGAMGEPLDVHLVYDGKTDAGEDYGPTEVPPTDAGKYTVTASTPGDVNNEAGSNTAELTIMPAKAKVLAVEALRIRKGPSIHANVLNWLRHDEVVNVISTHADDDGKWAQIKPGQWSSIWYKEKTWMEYVLPGRE